MAKTFSLNKSSDGQSVVATRQESELHNDYQEYVANNPDFEYHVSEQSPSADQPTTQQQKNSIASGLKTSAEPAYNYDAHFSQQWFLDELENRKNPEYVKQGTDIMDDDTFNAISNAIKIRKDANPNQWTYGDPGWKTDTTLYQDYIKPMEEKYRQQIHNAQIAEMSKSTYDDVMANTKYNPSKDAGVSTEKGNFDKLPVSGKISNLAMPGVAGTDIENAPAAAKFTQPLAQAFASSGGVAGLARDAAITLGIPGAGWVYGGVKLADFAYSYTKAFGLHEGNKVYDKIKEVIDMPDEKMQQALGALNYAFEQAGGGDLADSSKTIENIDFLVKNFDTIWDHAFGSKKASTEYDSDIVGLVTGSTANMGATPVIGNVADRFILNMGSSLFDDDMNYAGYGQVTRYNLGQSGVYDLPEEMTGSNATTYWLKTVQGWRDEGIATDINDLTFLFWNELNKVYGDTANLSEFTEHEFFDPSNVAENMETRAVNLYAKATGDKNLEIASTPGSLIGDLTENIPGIGIIRTIGQTISGDKNFLKTSDGINEVLAAWDIENITNPQSQLTARDKRYSGIRDDGTLRRMDANPDKVLVDGKVGEFLANAVKLVQKTDETKAAYEGDAIFDYINVMVEDAIRARGDEDINTTIDRLTAFVDELEHPENISEDSPFYKSSQSALFNTIKDDVAQAVTANKQEIIKNIQRFQNLENNRNVLNTVSSALNMTPSQFMEKYNNDKVTLTQMIVNKAEENGGMIPGVDIPVDTPDFGKAVIDMVKPFAGDDGQAYDVRQLGLQLTSSLADGVSDMLVHKYNIQPAGLTYRFGDMIKKMQSLVLLGLSPSYLANNFVNNVATRTALGYGGFLSGKTMNDWMTRFGWTPERMQESFTQDYLGQTNTASASGKLEGKIREKRNEVDGKKIKKGLADFMKKTGDIAFDVNQKVGVFSNISGQVEQAESKQVSVSAMMTYMARTWKPGVNFRKMPVQLEAAINAQCPGMVDAIYAAISAGMNMAEIENAIFGSFVAPSVKDTMIQAAKNLGFERAEDIVTEYFTKGAMLDQLNEALKGKRGDEIDKIVNDYGDYLKKILAVQLTENIANKQKSVTQDMNVGFSEALDWAHKLSDDMMNVWLNSQDANTSIFQRRLRDGMGAKEFHALYQEHLKDLNERWQNVYRQSEQEWNGILKGLNVKGRNETAFINNLNKKNNLWAKFYDQTQPKLFQPYLDALEWRADDTQETWDSRVQKAWNTYITKVSAEVQKIHQKEADYQAKMDQAFLNGLKRSLGQTKAAEVDATIAPMIETINSKRQQIIDQTKVVRDIADNTKDLNKKNEAWAEAEATLKQLKQQYADAQQQMYDAVKRIGLDTYETVQETMSEPADIETNIQIDVAEEQADKNKKEARQMAEVLVDAALNGTLDDIDDTSPSNWKMEVNRKNLRDVAMKAGATKEQADAYARYVGAVARAWERRNPGKDFFIDKLGLSVEYIDEARVVEDTDGNLYQLAGSETLKITPELSNMLYYNSYDFFDAEMEGPFTWNDIYNEVYEWMNLSDEYNDYLGISFYDDDPKADYAFPFFRRVDGLLEAVKENTDYDNLIEGNSESGNKAISQNNSILYSFASVYNARKTLDKLLRDVKEGRLSEKELLQLFGVIRKPTELDYIPYKLTLADIDTPEFKAFYGNHPEMFEYGQPIVVYNGSGNNHIAWFDERKRGSGAGGDDTSDVWYYSKSDIVAGSYAWHPKENQSADLAQEYLFKKINERKQDNINEINESVQNYLSGTREEVIQNLTGFKDWARDWIENISVDGFDKKSLSLIIVKRCEEAIDQIKQGTNPSEIKNYDETIEAIRKGLAISYLQDSDFEGYSNIHPKSEWYTKPYYLSIKNPYVVDLHGARWGENGTLEKYINYARKNGHDGIIVKNIIDGANTVSTDYLVFNSNQAKSIYNEGAFSESKNIYRQTAEQRIKGEFKIKDGEKLVQLFRGSDFSTLVHETMGHGFSTTLERNQQEALAAYNGWTLFRYRQLENQFYNGPDSMDAKDRQDWIDAQERFAYGFEQYLMEGKAPNDGIRSVFEAFRQFLLDIYQGIRKLVYKGEEIDIHKKQNGVTLAEIFDSMLDESETRGHKWQGTTEFNITGQENFQMGEGESQSFGSTINDKNRKFFQSESERQLEKVIKIKQAAENKLRGDVADYVADLSKKWNLTPEEAEEFIVETMHRMGLNQGLPENPALKQSIQLKLGKYDRKQMDKFVMDHMAEAVKIDDKAIDALLKDNVYYGQGDHSFGYSFGQTDQNSQAAFEARRAQAQADLKDGKFVPVEYIDLNTLEASGSRDALVDNLAKRLHEASQKDGNTLFQPTLEEIKAYILNSVGEDGIELLPKTIKQDIDTMVQFIDDENHTLDKQIRALQNNQKQPVEIPLRGTYVAETFLFEHGQYEIVGVVTNNGKPVAYVPSEMPVTEVEANDGHKIRVLGVSVVNPEQVVYDDNGRIKTTKIRQDDGTNPYKGEMSSDVMGALDPIAEAHNQMSYEQILPMLDEFKRLYKQNLDNNMTSQKYSNLDENTRSLLRGYIDRDVRTDLANTKYKAGKFGNMMRDAALLNYNNRYGWDNALTFLAPYQFWQTRSFQKWLSRMGSKGGKMWRRYAKLLELEKRNKKEFMPSRVSGLFGLYLPFLPDWMGDAVFVSPDQFLVVPQFIKPILEQFDEKNNVLAVAERNLQEALRDEKITYEQYKAAMDPATRENNALWQEYLSKAQLTEGADKNLGDMLGQYLGMSLPLSIYQAVSQHDNSKWNQWPITRTGTAWRATFGDNFIGNLGQDIFSAPERALRDAVSKKYGTDFEYNEFGAFGDYYITQQVWDMVAEGRIDPADAVQAVNEKGDNKVWNEAADRQREELLVKMQGGQAVDAVKRLISGEGDAKDNWMMLLTGLVTAPMSKQIVREGETDWRKQKAEYSESWDTYNAGDKEALNRFDDKNPNYRYNNLRYEKDPEQALRKYLYNSISQKWYDLDKAEQSQLQMSFNDNFYDDVLNKETRVIETMDINRLAAYAQALNGKIPNLATDKINLQNLQTINVMDIPQTTLNKVTAYYAERDAQFPGMDKVEKIYYALPVEVRKAFRDANQNLTKYWDWKKQYKKANPDVADFLKLSSASYDMRDAEEVISNLDSLTIQELTWAARAGKEPDKAYKPLIESAMKRAGITDKYEDYLKDLNKYILGK